MADDYYSVLGVPRSATEKEIKTAYRKLARKLHPDVNPGDHAAEERFKKVNEAHDVLGDTKKRKDYDEFGENWRHADELRKAGAAAGGFRGGYSTYAGAGGSRASAESIFDLFGNGGSGSGVFDMFGGPGGARARQAVLEGTVQVSLEEAFHGSTRRISVDGPSGSRTLEVVIPAGIQDNGRIRLSPDPDTEVLLTVKVMPHRVFTRSGDDLHAEARVSYLDAVLGGEVEVPTLTGRIALTIPPGTQNGRSFRIPGKGMPKRGSDEFGDLIVSVRVRLPEKVTDEQRQLFERLRALERSEADVKGGGR